MIESDEARRLAELHERRRLADERCRRQVARLAAAVANAAQAAQRLRAHVTAKRNALSAAPGTA